MAAVNCMEQNRETYHLSKNHEEDGYNFNDIIDKMNVILDTNKNP